MLITRTIQLLLPHRPTPNPIHGAGAILHPGRASYRPPVGEWKDGFFDCFNQCAPSCECPKAIYTAL